ncbi:MAG: hypothetical protein JXA16_10590 [Bacteroidales bacterium]|nr:hypothetical protein [Bacteroidales bacterium]
MNVISEFSYQEDSFFVGWMYHNKIIRKLFLFKIIAIVLICKQKVIVLELTKRNDNAIIFDGFGEEIKRIKSPDPMSVGFGDVYYVNKELVLISRRKDASMLAVVITEDGEIIRTHETR